MKEIKIVAHFIVAVLLILFSLYVWHTTQSYQSFLTKAFEYFLLILSLGICIKHFIQFVLSYVNYKKAIRHDSFITTVYNQQMEQLDIQKFHLDVRYDTNPKIFIDDVNKCFAILYEDSPLQIYRYSDIIRVNRIFKPESIKITLNSVYNPCMFLTIGNLDNIEFEKLVSTLTYIYYSFSHITK